MQDNKDKENLRMKYRVQDKKTRRGGEIFCTHPDRSWSPPSLLHSGHRPLNRALSGRGVALTTHPRLAPRWKEE